MRLKNKALLSFLILMLLAGAALAQEKPTTVILVRHAEKATGQGDVELSEAGVKRADCLANALADSKIDMVLTTEYKRTMNTGAPVAKKLGVTASVVPGAKMDVLIDEIKKNAGKTILVVGHSNTVPAIVKKLGGGDYTITDSEYDKLYIVTLANGGATTVALRYCQ